MNKETSAGAGHVPADMPLSKVLASFGWTYRKNEKSTVTGSRDVIDADGNVLFSGTAWQAWRWLHQEHGVQTSADCTFCGKHHDLLDDCP